MTAPRMVDRITNLETLTFGAPQALAIDLLLDEPNANPPKLTGGFWLPSTWDVVDLDILWFLYAPPTTPGDLVLAVETAMYGDGAALRSPAEAGRVTVAQADLNVGHFHVTTVVEALDVTGDAGRVLSFNAFRDPADPDDTISIATAAGGLATVAARPNYTE